MDNKRYQIFISSTFSDLIEERDKVTQAVLKLGHFPAGMELFPAAGVPPINVIKDVIKNCDYYLLILAARYGSTYRDGRSFTEVEYDYAVEQGIPVFAFLHNNIKSIPSGKTDENDEKREKLQQFREKVEKSGIMVNYWDNANDLQAKVATSLPAAIKYQPREGWVRADAKVSGLEKEEFDKLKEEIGSLKRGNSQLQQKVSELEEKNKRAEKENKELEDELINLKASQTNNTENSLNNMDVQENENTDYWKEIYRINANVRYTYDLLPKDFNYRVEYSLKDWFTMIGLIIKNHSNRTSKYTIAEELGKKILEDSHYNQLLNDKAGKLVQAKTSSKIARVFFKTDLEIESIRIKEESINDIIIPLAHEDYLTIDFDYYIKLTEKGEDYLLQHCL